MAPCAALLVSAGPSEDQEVYTLSFQRGGRTQETFLGLRSLPVRYPQLAGVYTSASCALLHRVERMTTASQLEASEAWRKAGFLVRPFRGKHWRIGYFRTDAPLPEVITSACGTRQGDPLGAQLFALGLHPTLRAIASAVARRHLCFCLNASCAMTTSSFGRTTSTAEATMYVAVGLRAKEPLKKSLASTCAASSKGGAMP